jgi:hypothetical protein
MISGMRLGKAFCSSNTNRFFPVRIEYVGAIVQMIKYSNTNAGFVLLRTGIPKEGTCDERFSDGSLGVGAGGEKAPCLGLILKSIQNAGSNLISRG